MVKINHTCGHSVDHNAFGKRVEWLKTKPCPECAGLKPREKSSRPRVENDKVAEDMAKNADTLPIDLADGCKLEYRFHTERRWRFDYAWPGVKVALEVEGGGWVGGHHSRGKGFEADIEKYNTATAEGWSVVRCTPRQLRSDWAWPFVRRLIAMKSAWLRAVAMAG